MLNSQVQYLKRRICSLFITVKISTYHYKRSIVVLQRCHDLMLQGVFSWYKGTWWFDTNLSKNHIIIFSFVFSMQIKHKEIRPTKVCAYFSALTESSWLHYWQTINMLLTRQTAKPWPFPHNSPCNVNVKFLFSLLFFEEGDVAVVLWWAQVHLSRPFHASSSGWCHSSSPNRLVITIVGEYISKYNL